MPDGPEPSFKATVTVPALRDFPDRIPAVVVKELRQGLKGRMFVTSFIVLQVLLIMTNAEPGRTATVNFWHFILLVLLFLLPSRNLSALGEERDANTLDTLVLTRLTPWRIVWGKWCATAALSAVTVVAILPHLLVRYLNGGTNLLQEAMLLVVVLLLSGALAGFFTAISNIKSQLARNGLALTVMLGTYGLICVPLIVEPASRGGDLSRPVLFETMVLSVWATLFCLWRAAAHVAPAVADVTTPRRLTSLVAVPVLSLIAGAVSSTTDKLFAGILMGMLAAVTFVETGEKLPVHPRPPASSKFRALTDALLRPGWNSGVLYCVVLWILAGLLSGFVREPAFPAAAALCFFPVTARLLLPARRRFGASPAILLALASHVIRMVLTSLDQRPESPAAFIPGLPVGHPAGNPFRPEWALVWVGLAAVLAVESLIRQARRRTE